VKDEKAGKEEGGLDFDICLGTPSSSYARIHQLAILS